MKKNILIIAAHPDDEVLGMGGTIAKKAFEGFNIKVLFISEGSSCRFNEVNDPQSIIEIKKRNECATEALKILGVDDIEFLNLPCGRLDTVPVIEINKSIEDCIYRFKPTIIYTHSKGDVNNDHKIVNRSVEMAVRPVNNSSIIEVLCFEVLSSSEWVLSDSDVFCPNSFEVLNDQLIELKWLSLSCYYTEIAKYPFSRSKEAIYALAMYRGIQIGKKYAEGFNLCRRISE